MKLRIKEADWTRFSAALRSERALESAGVVLATFDKASRTLVARDLFVLEEDSYTVRKADQLEIHPVALNRYTRMARAEGLSILTVHTHPRTRDPWFSRADDLGDARLMPSFYVQSPGPHGSLVIAGDSGETAARLWCEGGPESLTLRIVGRTLQTMSMGKGASGDADHFARQELALGTHGQRLLRALHVGVVGLGGTGSVSAMQLAHIGVGKLTLVDGDYVERSNVSRIAGATRESAESRQLKVDVARRYIEQLSLQTEVETHPSHLGEGVSADVLAACDVILSCVDRHTPRAILNRIAYEQLVPVVDMGSGFRVDRHGRMASGAGRVVVVGPGRPCLACWGHVDARALYVEALSPEERAAQARDGYVDGADIEQPSVMPFNTMLAGAAVIELLRLVTGFLGGDEPPNRLSFGFADGTVKRNHLAVGEECRICGGTKECTARSA